MYYRGNEFLGHAFNNDLIKTEYGIKTMCTTTANTQENSILERIHQVITNLVRMFDLKIIIQTRMKPGQGYYQLRFLRYKARTILRFKP